MNHLQDKQEAVKAAIASAATCTSVTVISVRELLGLPSPNNTAPVNKPATARGHARTKSTPLPRNAPTRNNGSATKLPSGELPAKEKTILATFIINAALKSLTEATKPQPLESQSPSRARDQKRTLRRSNSAPLSPLKARTLNRVATSPLITSKTNRSAAAGVTATGNTQSTGCLAVAECARAAFACLRNLKGPIQPGQADFQLEQGASALIGKLITLGLHDQALKELKDLKMRLDSKYQPKEAVSTPAFVTELLKITPTLPTAILSALSTCQIQTLRILAAVKKPALTEAAISLLEHSNPSSPIGLLSKLAQGGSGKEAERVARQMAALSQILLSLAPGVSSKDDSVAMEARLSVRPEDALKLQQLALHAQLAWWELSGHKGKTEEEVMTPLGRCLRAFARRCNISEPAKYDAMAAVYTSIQTAIDAKYAPAIESTDSPMASIYQLLGAAAQKAKQYDQAHDWLGKVKVIDDKNPKSSVRSSTIAAHLLAVKLKRQNAAGDSLTQLEQVTRALDGPLSGTAQELNELLEALSAARRVVVGCLMQNASSMTEDGPFSNNLRQFVLKYPRFLRRWLGSQPGKDAPPKATLQYDQRRQCIVGSTEQVMDAVFVVVKTQLQSSTISWLRMDEILQDCVGLLASINDPSLGGAKLDCIGTCLVKVSNLYYAKHTMTRKEAGKSTDHQKQALQSLHRSINAVQDCSSANKAKAQLCSKLEVFADLCKAAGRTEDAVRTLRSVCTSMTEDGVLSEVAALLDKQSPSTAWAANERASTLSRTLRSIAKLDASWSDWTFFLPEAERAAVLEHLIHIINSDSSTSQEVLRLRQPGVAALLRIYSVEAHPIRRLRVLLRLFYQNMGNKDEIYMLNAMIQPAMEQVDGKLLGKDKALSRFSPHLHAYHQFVTALDAADQDWATRMHDAMTQWKETIGPCQTPAQLHDLLDTPEEVLSDLKSASELATLRGEYTLQLAILDVERTLSRILAQSSALLVSSSRLVSVYVKMGFLTKAAQMMEEIHASFTNPESPSSLHLGDVFLAQAEMQTEMGKISEAMESLSKVPVRSPSSSASRKLELLASFSTASLLRSVLYLQAGQIQDAMSAVKVSVRTLTHEWTKLEKDVSPSILIRDGEAVESNTEKKGGATMLKKKSTMTGPACWRLAIPLIRSLLQISSLYAHIGLFQETIYYAENAYEIADRAGSGFYRAEIASWIGSAYGKAGRMEKAIPRFEDVEACLPAEPCSTRVQLSKQLADFYLLQGDQQKAHQFLEVAEQTTKLMSAETPPAEQPAGEAAPVAKMVQRASRSTTRTRAPTTTATARVPKRATGKKNGKGSPAQDEELPKDVHHASLLSAIAMSRALGFIQERKWSSALSCLEPLKSLPKILNTLPQEQIATAMSLIGHSMDQLNSDPVFSVMQYSTISFPAVSCASDRTSETICRNGSSPVKGRAAAAKMKTMPAFIEALCQAQDLLLEAHESGHARSESSVVHRIAALLQSTIILLSATATTDKITAAAYTTFAMVASDLARNIAWKREQKAVAHTSELSSSAVVASEVSTGHAEYTRKRRSSFLPVSDLSRFQKTYVEVIPKSWDVISLSLSEDRHDLCITKYQAGHNPFVLRLPLQRHNAQDPDSEIFDFDTGRRELMDIIKLANESSHSARDFTARGERKAWWAEREGLDTRLGALLKTIETSWLGGFKGIFSQCERRPDLLARFQKSFQQILDGNLPSRKSHGRKKKTSKPSALTLDPRVLQLFIGLGDPTDPDLEFDEALNELLYLVVDILQFHGERNAYDEIDFDAMVVETYDALRAYHQHVADERVPGAHTVLILDKALHAFPWESLPCMDGLAVSRVPSLAHLRQLLSEANGPADGQHPSREGHHVSMRQGTYILNPSSDLKNTQTFFQPSFSSLKSWTGIVKKEPSEAEFETALSKSEILLYFGHGSGAQYVKGKTVKRLEKCKPTTFLMGCSSVALSTAGEFECYGPVWNYMMAGCPAVVGALWDVTDRDIDRFAGQAFEEWGLFPKGSFQDKRSSKKAQGQDESDETSEGVRDLDVTRRVDEDETDGEAKSLVEAVARARRVCRFRYLNAAAVVVYGIPAYLTA